jgi:triphosphoribosyl-dephospho-CoA synthase
LLEVMSLAADRDMIAKQYASGFRDIFQDGVPALLDGWARFGRVETAILTCQLHWLARFPDSLIVRKRGVAVAAEAMQRARAVDLAAGDGWERFGEFDRWLRADGHSRNPGTTADLVTACLFVALREHRMEVEMPFDSGIGYRASD